MSIVEPVGQPTVDVSHLPLGRDVTEDYAAERKRRCRASPRNGRDD